MKIDLDRYHSIYISCLFEVLDLLDKKNINYSLAFGTMLGAVREHDIIKWDFDIDILIDDEDVKTNLDLFKSFGNNKYYFKTYLNGELQYGISRIYIKGLKIRRSYMKENPYYDTYIDIYSFRRMKKNSNYNDKTVKKIKKYMLMQSIKYDLDYSKNIFKKMFKKIFVNFIPDYDTFKNIYEKIVSKVQTPDSNSIIILFPHAFLRDFPAGNYDFMNIMFHGRKCKCFKNVTGFLTTVYGPDFMIPKNDGRLTSDMEFEFER